MLQTQKIKGISTKKSSFFSQGATIRSSFQKEDFLNSLNLKYIEQELRTDFPPQFNHKDIKRLMHDLAHAEIHTHANQCVDLMGKWSSIVKTLENNLELNHALKKETFVSDFLKERKDKEKTLPELNEKITQMREFLTLYLEVKKMLFLFKHNLSILEMIVNTQKLLNS